MSGLIVSLGLFWSFIIIFVLVLWALLPFAVFGIKSRLDYQNRLLISIRDQLKQNAAIDQQ